MSMGPFNIHLRIQLDWTVCSFNRAINPNEMNTDDSLVIYLRIHLSEYNDIYTFLKRILFGVSRVSHSQLPVFQQNKEAKPMLFR